VARGPAKQLGVHDNRIAHEGGWQRAKRSPRLPTTRPALAASAAQKFAHVSGGECGGLGTVGLRQKLVEVLAGELPLEGRGDLFVAASEGEL
jgi:hypothetical protein